VAGAGAWHMVSSCTFSHKTQNAFNNCGYDCAGSVVFDPAGHESLIPNVRLIFQMNFDAAPLVSNAWQHPHKKQFP